MIVPEALLLLRCWITLTFLPLRWSFIFAEIYYEAAVHGEALPRVAPRFCATIPVAGYAQAQDFQ